MYTVTVLQDGSQTDDCDEKKGKVSFYTSSTEIETDSEPAFTEPQQQKVASFPGKPQCKKMDSPMNPDKISRAEDVVDGFEPLFDKLDLNFIDDEDHVDGPLQETALNSRKKNKNPKSSLSPATDSQAKDVNFDCVTNGVTKTGSADSNQDKSSRIVSDSTEDELVKSIVDVLSSVGDDIKQEKVDVATSNLHKQDVNVITSSPKTSISKVQKRDYSFECCVEEADLISAPESPVKVSFI